MYNWIIFAVITATAFWFWTFFHKLASPYINNLLGAVIVSLVAVIIGLIFFLPNMKSALLFTNYKGLIFVILAGICAIFIDYFALKTYWTNLPISIAWPIIMWWSIAVAVILGFFIWEIITIGKLSWIFLIIAWAIILSLSDK